MERREWINKLKEVNAKPGSIWFFFKLNNGEKWLKETDMHEYLEFYQSIGYPPETLFNIVEHSKDAIFENTVIITSLVEKLNEKIIIKEGQRKSICFKHGSTT